MVIVDCEISGCVVIDNVNGVTGQGGGIWTSVPTVISMSEVKGNYAAFGGGIYRDGSATTVIEHCNVEGNNAAKAVGSTVTDRQSGGGIFIAGTGKVDVTDTTFLNNKAIESGGGVYVTGAVTVNLLENTIGMFIGSSDLGNQAKKGGGLAVVNKNAAVTVDSCTVDENIAYNSGGGIYAVGGLAIKNSTISNNLAEGTDDDKKLTGSGGGIYYNQAGSPEISNSTIYGNVSLKGGGISYYGLDSFDLPAIYNSTIANNEATGAVPGVASEGGGIFLANFSGKLIIDSTIAGDNIGDKGPDIFGGKVTEHFGLISNISDILFDPLPGLDSHNQVATGLDSNGLMFHGGSTKTVRLVAGSIAIDSGRNSLALANDQRGMGFAREEKALTTSSGPIADIGAYEVQLQVLKVEVFGPVDPSVDPLSAIQRSMVNHIRITFTDSIEIDETNGPAVQLDRLVAVGEQSGIKGLVNLTSVAANNTITVTFNSSGSNPINAVNGSLPDGIYQLTIVASRVHVAGSSVLFLDSNDNGTSGEVPDDNFVYGTATNHFIFRYFGDIDGSGGDHANDFIQFKQYFNGTNPFFDYDNDGSVSSSDFVQFRLRFNGDLF